MTYFGLLSMHLLYLILSQLSVWDFPDFLTPPSNCEKFISQLQTGDKFPGMTQTHLTHWAWSGLLETLVRDLSNKQIKERRNHVDCSILSLVQKGESISQYGLKMNIRVALRHSSHLQPLKILWSSKLKKILTLQQKYLLAMVMRYTCYADKILLYY